MAQKGIVFKCLKKLNKVQIPAYSKTLQQQSKKR
jgi:hypothetical protein